jgi:hypothetical protein
VAFEISCLSWSPVACDHVTGPQCTVLVRTDTPTYHVAVGAYVTDFTLRVSEYQRLVPNQTHHLPNTKLLRRTVSPVTTDTFKETGCNYWKITACRDTVTCSLPEVDRWKYSRRQLNETTRRYIPERSQLHTRRRKNLKSYCNSFLVYLIVKFRVFGGVGPSILVGVDRRFRGTYCLHHQHDDFALMMEAVRTTEPSVYSETTRRYIPEDCKLHTRRRENLKSRIFRCVS